MKTGIVSHYYNSKNYGGNLQAYALCRVIRKAGYEAEQIPYKRGKDKCNETTSKIRISRIVNRIKIKVTSVLYRKKGKDLLKKRDAAVSVFNQNMIPHADSVYTVDTIGQTVSQYDALIVGSDQVWHPSAVCGPYLLDFADGEKIPKFSYAASLSVNAISEPYAERLKKSLKDYQAVSVREEKAVELLRDISEQKIEQVLDPTLLLDAEDWDEVAQEYPIDGDYIFCYFLGGRPGIREIVQKFAKKHGLKIVTFPYLQGRYRKCDDRFGDVKIFDADPAQFIGLIKGASYIFTDSYHATAFSLLYQKEFFSFERTSGKASMGSRLHTLTETFGVKERFCDTAEKETLEYIDSLPAVDYGSAFPAFALLKKKSISYLLKNLELAKEKCEG